MTEAELEWLRDAAACSESVLEIGTWKGRSTAALAAGCSGRVVTVDHFQGSPSEVETDQAEALTNDLFAEAVTNLCGFVNVEILRMSSMEAGERLAEERFDMVFIDGEHTEEAVRMDLDLWGGSASRLLCGHDRTLPGVAAALEGLSVNDGPDSIWWMNRG
jgi:nitrogen regulatory protein PII-like uncharacterized protein